MSILLLIQGSTKGYGVALTDTGASVSDVLARHNIRTTLTLTDTGKSGTDTLVKNALGPRTARTVTDTGATISDAITTGARSRTAADVFTDGASATFGVATLSGAQFSAFTDTFNNYAAPAVAPDPYYARLPLAEAQAALSSTAVVPNTYAAVSCSWHGQLTDPERGSFILVRAGGSLEGRVGQRVQILLRGSKGSGSLGGVVYGYVHGIADLDPRDDVSVPRRLFMQLALPGFDRIPVVVETLQAP